jgi:competence protein ComEC
VLEVLVGDVAMLLTGDISAAIEAEIAPQLSPATTRILKVAHHGSRTSSSSLLLEAWRPQIALISCGRGNRFGHPTTEVLERLRSVGALIYRTDRDGQITVETDGRHVRTTTWMKRSGLTE